jgi:hypothetical protein
MIRRSLSGPSVSLVRLTSGEPAAIMQGRLRPSLPPVDELHMLKGVKDMRRPSSMALPSKPVNGHAGIDRSRSLSSRPHVPRKRDSLDLQRAKAFDSPCQIFL